MTEGAGAAGFAGDPIVIAGNGRRYAKVLRLLQRKARAQERLRQVEIAVDYELALMRDEEAAAAAERNAHGVVE